MRPIGVTVDSDNNLYIADSFNRRVRKVSPGGTITTVAGSGPVYPDPGGFAGDGGLADRALLKFTSGVAIDAKGNLFIADNGNNRVRMVTPAGTISTVAGIGGPNGSSGDSGPALAAQVDPWGVVVDDAGRLYIADPDNHRVRMVALDGTISTVAGGGNPADGVGDGGLATRARLDAPAQLALDGAGNLFIADSGSQRIRRVGPVGIISTVAGTGQVGFSPDGTTAKEADLNGPYGLAFDKAGNLYFSEVGTITVTDGATSFPGEGAVPLVREVVGVGVPR
jgi:sugar lactone lactonase YvrE